MIEISEITMSSPISICNLIKVIKWVEDTYDNTKEDVLILELYYTEPKQDIIMCVFTDDGNKTFHVAIDINRLSNFTS